MRLYRFLPLILVPLLLPAPVQAQSPEQAAALQEANRLWREGATRLAAGDVAGARDLFARMLASCPLTPPQSQPHCRVLGHMYTAATWQRTDNREQEEKEGRTAADIARAELPPGNPRIGEAIMQYARTLVRLKRHEEAETLFREALSYAQRAPEWPWLRRGIILMNLADAMTPRGANADILALAREAVTDLRPATNAFERGQLSNALHMLGRAQRQLAQGPADHAAAEAAQREALALSDDPNPSAQSHAVRVQAELAVTLATVNRWKEASPILHAVMDRLIARESNTGPLLAEAAVTYAEILFTERQFDAAEREADRALRIFEAINAPFHPRASHALVRLVAGDDRAGRRAAGDARLRRFAEATAAEPDSISLIQALAEPAGYCQDTGRGEIGLVFAERAFRAARAEAPEGSPVYLLALRRLAAAMNQTGDAEGAMALLRQGVALAATQPDGGGDEGIRLRLSLARRLLTDDLTKEVEEMYEALLRDAEARGMSNEVSAAANTLGQIRAEQGLTAEAEAYLRRAIASRDGPRPVSNYSQFITTNTLVSVLRRQGRYQEALAMAETSLADARAAFGPENDEVAGALYQLGNAQVAAMRVAEGMKNRRLALEMRLPLLGENNFLTILNLVVVAGDRMSEGDLAEAEVLTLRALAASEATYGPNHLRTAEVLGTLSDLRIMQGRYEEAGKHTERSLVIFRRIYGDVHPYIAGGQAALGRLFAAIGRADEAERRDRQALAITETVQGARHPAVAAYQSELAAILVAWGNFPEAKSLLGASTAILRDIHGSESPALAGNILALARIARMEGDSGLAATHAARAVRLQDQAGLGDRPAGAQAQTELASALLAQGKVADAAAHINRARATIARGGMLETPSAIGVLRTSALVALADKREPEAARDLDLALSLSRRFLGQDPVSLGAMLNDRALAASRQGQHAEAARFYDEALATLDQGGHGRHIVAAIVLSNRAVSLAALGRKREAQEARTKGQDILRGYIFLVKPPERWI